MKPFALLFFSALAFSCATTKPTTITKPPTFARVAKISDSSSLAKPEQQYFYLMPYELLKKDELDNLKHRLACTRNTQGNIQGTYYTYATSKTPKEVTESNYFGAHTKFITFIGAGTIAYYNDKEQFVCEGKALSEEQIVNSWEGSFQTKVPFPLNNPNN